MSLSKDRPEAPICVSTRSRRGAMNYAAQIALALLGFVVLIGGVTFISQYGTVASVQSPPPTAKAPEVGGPVELSFPETVKKWDSTAENEIELLSSGHYDFIFENGKSVPVNIGIHSIGCKCTGVTLCTLTSEEKSRYLLWAHGVPAFEAAMAHAGILQELTQITTENQATQGLENLKLHWGSEIRTADLKENPDKVVATVAPKAAGLVRINFQGKSTSPGSQRLLLDLWTQATEGPQMQRATVKLEYTVTYVPPVQVMPGNVDLEDLGLGEEKLCHFVVWSSTRANFSLKAYEARNDPCFMCTYSPMTPEECGEFVAGSQGHARVLAGYHVTLTVKERVSDKVQMDLGPFQRRIVVVTDPGIADQSILLAGNVRGDVVVGAPEDQGKIKLGTFSSSTGKKQLVHLTTLQPSMDLKLEKIEPETLDYLQVKSLKKVHSPEDAKSFWELAIEIPPGCPPGSLPRQTAIVLMAPGDPPRHVRIPVFGTAFQ